MSPAVMMTCANCLTQILRPVCAYDVQNIRLITYPSAISAVDAVMSLTNMCLAGLIFMKKLNSC